MDYSYYIGIGSVRQLPLDDGMSQLVSVVPGDAVRKGWEGDVHIERNASSIHEKRQWQLRARRSFIRRLGYSVYLRRKLVKTTQGKSIRHLEIASLDDPMILGSGATEHLSDVVNFGICTVLLAGW